MKPPPRMHMRSLGFTDAELAALESLMTAGGFATLGALVRTALFNQARVMQRALPTGVFATRRAKVRT